MEQFKTALKKRLVAMAAYNVLLLGLICLALLGPVAGGDDRMRAFLAGFNTGLFAVAQGTLLLGMVRYAAAIRDGEKLKALYIREHDERLLFIQSKVGGAAMQCVLYGLLAATLAAGYFNQLVFFTLLGAVAFSALVKAAFKIYYERKVG